MYYIITGFDHATSEYSYTNYILYISQYIPQKVSIICRTYVPNSLYTAPEIRIWISRFQTAGYILYLNMP